MKINYGLFFGMIFGILMIGSVSAICSLSVKLINQDPYPALPGEEVKVVFQLEGVSNPECKNVVFEFVESFPFTLSPGQNAIATAEGGAVSDFKTYLLIPYKLKIDKDASDGDNELEVKFSSGAGDKKFISTKKFDINVNDLATDFEISIKDYMTSTRTLTFEILNIGEHDVEALTIEIPKQENIQIKGSSRNIVGSLDGNEDTTFSFEAIPRDGKVDLIISYTDEINERRQVQKSVIYDSSYFTDRARDKNGSKTGWYASIIILLIIIFWYFWRRKKKRDAHRRKHELHHE